MLKQIVHIIITRNPNSQISQLSGVHKFFVGKQDVLYGVKGAGPLAGEVKEGAEPPSLVFLLFLFYSRRDMAL